MDHTPVDLIVVDPVDRVPIGRPWITVAIDVFSRCIGRLHLSLETPSATSVGLCLTSVACEKAPWLHQRGIEAHWPVFGKPRRLGVNNAAEFHSAAFERGCAQHGIAIEWRPPGQPHFGGIVERVVGTLMQLVHTLPGTTFSNPAERGSYDSDKTACLTLEDLERWLAVAITKYYHVRPHEGLDDETPLHRYEQGVQALIAAGKTVPVARDPRAFLIDFLPVVRRSLQRNGITIDHITYFSNALCPWIRRRDQLGPLLIRRDPRDLSRIFVLDAENNTYSRCRIECCRVQRSRCGSTNWRASACASSGAPSLTRRICSRHRRDARDRARGRDPHAHRPPQPDPAPGRSDARSGARCPVGGADGVRACGSDDRHRPRAPV